ncbi:hypothetical protein ACFV42_48080 [Streptomyces solisilvae]|uniref:hypothetical protein n=1 Tax=Streptomyces malaysiensis TaxID=92644 RepID=UPI0036D0A43D
MPVLIKEDHLRGFLISLGLPGTSLADLDHEALLGFTTAILDYEAHAAAQPNSPQAYGHDGYMGACKTLASGGTGQSDPVTYGTLSVRLAQRTIGRLVNQISELEAADPETSRLARPVLPLLMGAGMLMGLANSRFTDGEHKETVKAVQGCIVRARGALDDLKRSMRARGISI